MGALLEQVVASLIGAGGAAAIFGALVKSWFALQVEKFKREQAQQLEAIKADLSLVTRLRGSAEEKRAAVAAEILISSLQFLDFLRSVTKPTWVGPAESGQDGFIKEINSRWQAAHEIQLAFSKAWTLSETYLPPEVGDLMERIWKMRTEIHVSQSMHFDMAAQGGPRDMQFWERGFGESVRSNVSVLRDEAKGLLRPIAQLELGPQATAGRSVPTIAAVAEVALSGDT
jgi:hypothetical protein